MLELSFKNKRKKKDSDFITVSILHQVLAVSYPVIAISRFRKAIISFGAKGKSNMYVYNGMYYCRHIKTSKCVFLYVNKHKKALMVSGLW